ncbi:NAD(P)/FAD-dependent oxidoreductase [Synechococcus sp. WH 8101]|uniref:NAD(P)/FAD-dependent oxidoreductase n=2 Tax=Synechococcus sp. WH 8101 TaxID=59932 RepID=UPI001023921A|nr:NAD(P)/FAD-dependent oxidoreductase [Synechococcus sp. WH 8101]
MRRHAAKQPYTAAYIESTRLKRGAVSLGTKLKMASTQNQTREVNVDVLIVGLGPAGTACGLELNATGIKVLGIDRSHFPRDKICGDALPTEAQFEVDRLGLGQSCPEIRTTSRFAQWSPDGSPSYQHCFQTQAPIFQAIRRYDLDNWLVRQCASEGLWMEFGWKVQVIQRDNKNKTWIASGSIHSKRGLRIGSFSIYTRCIVGCDGVGSVVRRATERSKETKTIVLASRCYRLVDPSRNHNQSTIAFRWQGTGAYSWRFAVPGGHNCGIAWLCQSDQPKISGKAIIDLTRTLEPGCRDVRTMGLPILQSIPSIDGAEGIFLCGDAACLVDPLLGHGIDRAMKSGKLAGKALRESLKKGEKPAETSFRYRENLAKQCNEWLNRCS